MPHRSQPIEPLEPRLLLSSVKVHDDRLTICGDGTAPNDIAISLDKSEDHVLVTLNGVDYKFDKDNIDNIRVVGGNLDDYIHVDQTVVDFTVKTAFFGNDGDDNLVGGKESDTFWCDDGDDTVSGGNGTDRIMGGNGNDTIVANKGLKLVFGEEGDDNITIGGGGRGYIFGQNGNDILDSHGTKFELLGNQGDDTITGSNGGNDTIWGGDGADVILGQGQKHDGEIEQVGKLINELMPDRPNVKCPP